MNHKTTLWSSEWGRNVELSPGVHKLSPKLDATSKIQAVEERHEKSSIQLLDATVQHLHATAIWCPVFVYPWRKSHLTLMGTSYRQGMSSYFCAIPCSNHRTTKSYCSCIQWSRDWTCRTQACWPLATSLFCITKTGKRLGVVTKVGMSWMQTKILWARICFKVPRNQLNWYYWYLQPDTGTAATLNGSSMFTRSRMRRKNF
jgi:hypothetical protein